MNELVINEQNIQNKIYTIRGIQVMLDRDLASLYGVETKVFNQAVKRNIDRFPSDFMFQLSKEEFENWRSQIVTSNSDKMGLRRPPYVFTEQGVSMLSSILKSQTAIDISVKIIRTFVQMRRYMINNAGLFQRIEKLESDKKTTNQKLDTVLNAIESKELKPKQGIFYNGQIYDAYAFVSELIKQAKNSITLFDNYIDESVLTMLSKNQNVTISIYTKTISKQLKLDVQKYNDQYNPIEIKKFNASHDRFLIIDENEVYHIGASLKDLGKKWFGFSKMDSESFEMMGRLK